MGILAGGALRITSTLVYFLEFCCAGIGLSIYSYFLAKRSIHHLRISNDLKAVEGLTGAAVLYTIFAVFLTCFLGGARFFAFLAIILDVAFIGAFIAVAVLTDNGADSCSAPIVFTPLGTGRPDSLGPAGTHLDLACRLNTAVFATAVIAALLFVISVILQFFIMRNQQSEKKYGPSPANNYTSGKGDRKFWQRKPKVVRDSYAANNNAEMGAIGGSAYGAPTEATHDTGYSGYSGTTMAQNDTYNNYKDTGHSGFHTGPIGTSVNPYGYNNQPTTGAAVNY